MPTGVVKFYNVRKGFGFIINDETQKDVYVHATGLLEKINQNDKVEFELVDEVRGVKAVNVRKINP